MILSAAELATLWCLPTADFADRVERVMAQWLPPPANAFIDPQNPAHLSMGLGERSDGSWAPIGMPYDMFRFIAWITAPMGRGKSVMLLNYMQGLLRAGAGFMGLDCKAKDLVNTTLPIIPLGREKDVTIVNLEGSRITGEDLRPGMNLLSPTLAKSLGLDPSMMASTVLDIFPTLDPRFNEAVGIKQFANFGMLALLGGEPQPTLMHLIRFFGDEDYRAQVVGRLPGAFIQVQDFWDRRFPEMPQTQQASLASFERRLDQLMSFPELQAMLVAPSCSIDLRKIMDNNGILLMGVSASQGQIASIAITLLLTQLRLAALSRTNVPEAQRPDWPIIVDEVQVIANDNIPLFKTMLSQFRSMRIGQVYVHQGLSQLVSEVMGALADNAGTRVILGCEADDASTYAGLYRALGLTQTDFTQMEVHPVHNYALHQYLKLAGRGNLFSAQPLPKPELIQEDAPPPVYRNWRTLMAPAANSRERDLDASILRFHELAKVRWDEAVQRLGAVCMHNPAAFDAFCARTKAHRLARRQFILDHPGCVRMDPDLDGIEAIQQQKVDRIRILSDLGSGVPKLETEAMAFALLMASREASAVRKERAEAAAEAKKAAKKGGGSVPPHRAAPTGPLGAPTAEELMQQDTVAALAAERDRATRTQLDTIPTLDELMAARGKRRAADDLVGGFEGFEPDADA
ncbi:MAG TPA: type IV secretory system conjugative DNA transfer family protein [Herpetosiphonaceae bacterium]